MSTLRVDPPFHFGWKHECDGGGTIQHLDLDVWSHDVSIYKDKKIHATMMLWKPTVPEETSISHPTGAVIYGNSSECYNEPTLQIQQTVIK